MSDSKDGYPNSNPSDNEDEMEPEPIACEVDPSELKRITVKIDVSGGRRKKVPDRCDVSEIKPVRRRDEGSRPIFDRPEIKEFYKKLREKRRSRSKAASCLDPEEKNLSEEARSYEDTKKTSDEDLKKTKRYSPSPEKRQGKSRDRREGRSPVRKDSKDLTRSFENTKKNDDDSKKLKRYSPSPEKRRGEYRGRSRDRRECISSVRRGGRSRERPRKPSEEKHRHSPDKFRHRRSRSRDRWSRSRDRRSRSRDRRSRSRDRRSRSHKRSRSREKRNKSVESSQDSSEKDKKKQLPPENCDIDYYEEDLVSYSGPNPGMSRGWRHPVHPIGRVRMPIHRRPPPFGPYPPPMGPVLLYPQALYPPYPGPPRMRGFMPR